MRAINHLGVKNAVPKTILQLMNVEGMTRENVASHLQKYRQYLKRMAGYPANVKVSHDDLQKIQQSVMEHEAAQQALQQSFGFFPMAPAPPMAFHPALAQLPYGGLGSMANANLHATMPTYPQLQWLSGQQASLPVFCQGVSMQRPLMSHLYSSPLGFPQSVPDVSGFPTATQAYNAAEPSNAVVEDSATAWTLPGAQQAQHSPNEHPLRAAQVGGASHGTDRLATSSRPLQPCSTLPSHHASAGPSSNPALINRGPSAVNLQSARHPGLPSRNSTH
ncbi:hypothetical protein WJX84_002536 [Apatococcus fuscideae]|uniref:HTH myb-type domain-containing protein n=1 Tax=Apatococcus fuscideae TaxID=2026836 RepID=A0AAW1SWQ8_9CHLO